MNSATNIGRLFGHLIKAVKKNGVLHVAIQTQDNKHKNHMHFLECKSNKNDGILKYKPNTFVGILCHFEGRHYTNRYGKRSYETYIALDNFQKI